MPAVFVHVSDIHFGQEWDERIHIHTDVKDQLIADAAEVVRSLPGGVAHGILVTGDIAQSGTREQYDQAGNWLDRLAEAIGCPVFRIQMVPGNHDLDREKLSIGGKHLLDDIKAGGAGVYEQILSNENDRATLFARFSAYAQFSEGYDCTLDPEGKLATNLVLELAPGRSVRFVRMNSALLCTGKEKEDEPELMIGHRQFIIPRNKGEENVVLIHHPLHWFKDSEDAKKYIRSRARVVISGHEHNPKVSIDKVEDGSDLMMLAAGATVPFKSSVTYTFTYNVIEFDWNAEQDALSVVLHPRAWNSEHTCFEADEKSLGGKEPRLVLLSPNFKKCGVAVAESHVPDQVPQVLHDTELAQVKMEPTIEMVPAFEVKEGSEMPLDNPDYHLILLRFFRDLTEAERLRILVDLDALTADSDERVTQALERQLLDWLVREGRISEVEKRVDQFISNRKKGNV